MKQDDFDRDKHLRPNFIQITTICIAIVVLIGIMAMVEAGKEKSNPYLMHIHTNLTITLDSRPIVIPSQIGIDNSLWNGHNLDKYGTPGMPMPGGSMPVMAPLHTHDNLGLIHIESLINRDYTLGEFFNIWGVDLNGKTVKATVNGKQVFGYKNIILKDKENIALDVTS